MRQNRTDVLIAAIEAVSRRNAKYGEPEENFRRWADLVNAYLASRREPADPLCPADMAIIAALMKIARLANDPTHLDSWVDLAGYAGCGAECASTA